MGLLPHDNLDPWDDGREERRMRTTERTLDTLRNYRVPSPSEMQEIYLDLRDLAAMERERDAALQNVKLSTQALETRHKLMKEAMTERDAAIAERDGLKEKYNAAAKCIASMRNDLDSAIVEREAAYRLHSETLAERNQAVCARSDKIIKLIAERNQLREALYQIEDRTDDQFVKSLARNTLEATNG